MCWQSLHLLVAFAVEDNVTLARYRIAQTSLTVRTNDALSPSQDEIGEFPHLGIVRGAAPVPIAIDFENASLITFEQSCKLELGVGILARAGVLQRLQREERTAWLACRYNH